MATSIFVPGLIEVSIAPSGGILAVLGYCSDGVNIREELRQRPVYGDQGGGAEGVPVDILFLGQFHILQFELYNYDGDLLTEVLKALPTTAAKVRNKTFDPGWLMRAGGDYFKLELRSKYHIDTARPAAFIRQYPVAMLTAAPTYNVGVHEMRVMMEFTCYPDADGTIFTVPS